MKFGRNIVTDGLLLHLDAANKSSYSGSGTNFYDLSGNIYNGTLTNGPTFDSSNNGSIVFDNANDYINVPINNDLILNSAGTIEAWVKLETLGGSFDNTIVMKGDGASWTNLHYVLFEPSGYDVMMLSTSNGVSATMTNGVKTPTLSVNVWYHVVATWQGVDFNRIYLNGELSQEKTTGIYQPKDTTTSCFFQIGRCYPNNYYFDGNIATTKIYNRALTSDEILQNYNSTKARFGL